MEKLLKKVIPIAEENNMEAFIVGSKGHYQGDEYLPDGRLLKLCPKGVKSRVLLEIESNHSDYKLYKHRNLALTNKYKGRIVTEEWIINFIKHNKSVAEEILASQTENAREPEREESKLQPLSDDEIQNRKNERHTVTCSCHGEVEDCANCYGKGYYVTDGFGKKI